MRPTSSPARSRPRRTGARLAAAAVGTALLTAGCGGGTRDAYENALYFGMPDPVTDQGQRIFDLWLGSVAAALVVGLAVWGLIFYACFRYRKRSEDLPRQVRYNLPVEVLYTVVPFVIIAVLFYYTAISQNYVNKVTEKPQVTVGVIGFQWNWTFRYDDGNADTVDPEVTGIPGQPAQLIIPTNRTVRFVLSSNDVIHSFWVPKFLFKRDNIPGRVNQYEITAREPGTYIGRCAELCGEKHDRMNFEVKVVPEQEYDEFMEGLRTGTNTVVNDAPEALPSAEPGDTGSPS